MQRATAPQSKSTKPQGDMDGGSASLVSRARGLRAQAGRLDPVLAVAYRRRAAELSFEAWLQAIQEAPVDVDRFTSVAA